MKIPIFKSMGEKAEEYRSPAPIRKLYSRNLFFKIDTIIY
tara:strand:- start:174 stop:293 length:120 start_codon:yes stop_codon:yes gene_type:complete